MENATSQQVVEVSQETGEGRGHPMEETVHQQIQEVSEWMQENLRQQERRAQERLREALYQQEKRAQDRMQEALEHQEKRMQEKVQQTLEEMEMKMEQSNKSIQGLVERLEGRIQKIEEAVEVVKLATCVQPEKVADLTGLEAVVSLQGRMKKLEMSVEKALESVFPRVEVLVGHLETFSKPGAPITIPTHASVDSCNQPMSISQSDPSTTDGEQSSAVNNSNRHSLGRELIGAVEDGNIDYVNHLINEGADPCFARGDGWTPLMSATKSCHADIISLLLNKGADIHARNFYGDTALHYAVEDRTNRCVTQLITAGANVNCSGELGSTPLHCAAHRDNRVVVEALLSAGADKTIRDNLGRTPFCVSWSDTVRQLLEH